MFQIQWKEAQPLMRTKNAENIAVIASGILLSCRYPGLLSLLMVICFLLPSFLLVLFLALYSDSGKTWKKNTVIFVFTFVFVVILLGALFVVLITYEAKLSSFTKTAALASFVLFMVGMGFSSLMDGPCYFWGVSEVL